MSDRQIYEQLAAEIHRGTPVCLVTIIDAQGSTPRAVGAKMLVFADGRTFGSLGGGYSEQQACDAASQCLLLSGKQRTLLIDLCEQHGTRGGDMCGGTIWINLEPYNHDILPEIDAFRENQASLMG